MSILRIKDKEGKWYVVRALKGEKGDGYTLTSEDKKEIAESVNITVDQNYNEKSKNAQSGIAVAQGIDGSVGDINAALASVVEPGEVDADDVIGEMVKESLEEIKTENEKNIAEQVKSAVLNLSAENEKTIKQQVAEAAEKLEGSIRRTFIANAKRVTDGNISFEENTIYVIARVPTGNKLTVYNPDTLEAVTISDRHYCIIVGNVGDDVAEAVCATVISYPSLDPQVYLIKNNTLQSSMSWTGTAIMSVVKNE